ncbi:hypothetical protein E1176_03025, partial [Fulvivirga sp. RKSG066]|uniref:LuxR C-terminal-related transcriptional regulator n=1 Tax=Fulvivirga aurantia TaxID=2529383 RepID=UPI0012BC4B86
IIGYTHEYLIKRGVEFLHDFIHKDDVKFVYQCLRKSWEFISTRATSSKKAYSSSFDCRIKTLTGDYLRILHQNKILNLDRRGNVLYVLGICTDISHWHKDEHASFTILGPEEAQNFYCACQEVSLDNSEKLSKRQRQVLQLLAEGHSSREISKKLNISENTVKVHRRNMLDKLNMHNTNHMIKFAVSHGLI